MADRLSRERLLTALLDSAEEAILGFSLDGTIETWSAGAERLYGMGHHLISAADILLEPAYRGNHPAEFEEDTSRLFAFLDVPAKPQSSRRCTFTCL